MLHLDHIGPLTNDAHGNEYILAVIDAFSRWIELFPTKSTTAIETASAILNHIGRFGTPEVIHTDQGPAFYNDLITELTTLCGMEHSFATAYSSEENGIVECANQEQLPLVQRIMNTVEKTSTGVTPAELILSHSIRLSSHIMFSLSSHIMYNICFLCFPCWSFIFNICSVLVRTYIDWHLFTFITSDSLSLTS